MSKKQSVSARQVAKFGEYRFRSRLPKEGETKAQGTIRAEIDPTDAEGAAATIYLYDVIDSWGGYWGCSASEFAEVLMGLPDSVDTICLRINSPGGDVYEAVAILNLLRGHAATTVAIVDGIAASAASFIACGCDQLYMGENTDMMIHDAWTVVAGNAAELRECAGFLDRVSDNIASIYATKSGGTVADWRSVMQDEAWYSAQEAVTALLADGVGMPSDDDTGGGDEDDEDDPAEPNKSVDPESPEPGYFSRMEQLLKAMPAAATDPEPEPVVPALAGGLSDVEMAVRERTNRMAQR